MPAPKNPRLDEGKVYRTRDLKHWSKNPTRLAKRLVRDGQLRQLGHGLFHVARESRFGPVPPDEDTLLRAFLGTRNYVASGSRAWNPLGLGTTAVDRYPLVYNAKRTGVLKVGPYIFEFRRVRHPTHPSPEYFAVDLFENRERAGVDVDTLTTSLGHALTEGRLDAADLLDTAADYGSKRTLELMLEVVAAV